MLKGDVIFEDISIYLIETNNENKIINENDKIGDDELKITCKDYDNACYLDVKFFSTLNSN